jgi:hypothetical protein
MENISPKKYIETRARKLPVYKCLVSADWKVDKMANVVVARRHVTGSLTIGYYLVDLMCLGVKDTSYEFNLPELEATELLEMYKDDLIEVDYPLAHNIIYAGHDFAIEFDIPPHRDFALTKNILEEDNDEVPLIEIETGDFDGKPHLMINPQGEGRWALEKLKKNAGEGNYYFTDKIGVVEGDEDEFDEDEFEIPERSGTVAEFKLGTINAIFATEINDEELMDEKILATRTILERIAMIAEGAVRTTEMAYGASIITDDELLDTTEFGLLENGIIEINSRDGMLLLHDLDPGDLIKKEMDSLERMPKEHKDAGLILIMEKHPLNLLLLVEAYQLAVSDENFPLLEKVIPELQSLSAAYPLAKLYVALHNYVLSEFPNDWPEVPLAKVAGIHMAFPEYEYFGEEELYHFWVLKAFNAIKENHIPAAVFYYKLVARTGLNSFFIIRLQTVITSFLIAAFPAEKK